MPMEVHVSDGTPSKSLPKLKSAMSSNPRPRICSTSMSGTRALDSKLRMASADVTCSSESAMSGEEEWAEVLAISKEISWRHAASKFVKCVKLDSAEWACWPWQWSRCERHGLGGETATTAETYCVHLLVKLFYAMA